MSNWYDQPLFFEHAGKQLYGVCYPAKTPVSPRVGLVICPAIGAEADMSIRIVVNFAREAQAAGLDVFRFDYWGCGESEGEFEETTLEGWLEDIHAAVAFFRSQANLQTVGLLGLRVGGTAAMLAASRNPAVEWVGLWEPIAFPQAYVDELLQMQLLSYNLWARTPLKNRQQLLALDDRIVELVGYSWRKDTLEALKRVDVLSHLRDLRKPSLIVRIVSGLNQASTSRALQALKEGLRGQAIPSEVVGVNAEIFWQKNTRPYLDLAKLRRQDQLFHHTLTWMLAQVHVPSYA